MVVFDSDCSAANLGEIPIITTAIMSSLMSFLIYKPYPFSRSNTLEFGSHPFDMYIVGNNNCLVINNTTEPITIREYKEMYSTTLQRRHPYTGREKNLESGKHACYNPSKLKEHWRRDHMNMKIISTELWVLFRGVKREMLSVSDFESNAGIVFNIQNNQLVKESVSREAANLSFLNHEKKLKQRLISIANQRNAASTSQPQQGES